MENAIKYKRKSQEDKNSQVLSLQSQERSIRETVPSYNTYKIIADFEESKSAKAPGRPKFNAMCELLEQGKAKYIICWQLNRLARNSVDGGRIIWLVQNHGVKIITPSKTYDANDILLMYVEFAMSNQFINDLKKSSGRGVEDKLIAGIAPILAPIGYFNDTTKKQGLRDILVDEERFHIVRKMWNLLLTGNYTPPKILEIATNEWGLRQRDGKPLSRSRIYMLFRNIFYTGKYYIFAGKLYDNGIHVPMITIDEYEKAQKIMGINGQFKFRPTEHTFAFNNGIITCICGSGITAHERYRKICPQCHLKYNAITNTSCPKCRTEAPEKTSYFCYYHCTRKKDQNCKEPSATPEDLRIQFDHALSFLTLPDEFIEWALEKLRRIHDEESKGRDTVQTSLQNHFNAATRQLNNLLAKYLSDANKDGELISDEEYKLQKERLTKEKADLEEVLHGTSQQQDSWMVTAEKAFDFVRTAREKFENGSKEERREIITAFGSNLTMENKIVRLDYLKPFGKIHEASKRLQDSSGKVEPVVQIDSKGQTYYFDSQNPVWGRVPSIIIPTNTFDSIMKGLQNLNYIGEMRERWNEIKRLQQAPLTTY